MYFYFLLSLFQILLLQVISSKKSPKNSPLPKKNKSHKPMQRGKILNKDFLLYYILPLQPPLNIEFLLSFFFLCLFCRLKKMTVNQFAFQRPHSQLEGQDIIPLKRRLSVTVKKFVTDRGSPLSHKFSFLKDWRDYHNHCLNCYITETM